jgi:tetratricopeptide (TPR) repeat protein
MHRLNKKLAMFYKRLFFQWRRVSIVYMGWISFLVCTTSACRKFIEVPLPGTETFPRDVYSGDLTATAAVVGIYGDMIKNNGLASGGTQSITFLCGLSADELQNYATGTAQRQFYENAINANNPSVESAIWDPAYHYIYRANAVLEGLAQSSGVTLDTKKQLQGEALFIRAFFHFYLVNLFGDVPYLDSTDYRINIVKARTPAATVYQRIISDLQEAQSKLSAAYITRERVRPNKWAATAFLARAYLYTGDWAKAEAQATKVIEQESDYSLDSLNGVFLKNSKEAIWQLMPNNTSGVNTWEGNNFILTTGPASEGTNSAVLSRHLRQSFESGDQRRINWVDSIAVNNGSNVVSYFFSYKYKIQIGTALKEYSMVLRLAELYLLRAEARAQQGNINGARSDLDMIRQRAGLAGTTANTKAALLAAIAHERRVELFTEWGHRWFDLKRTAQADVILDTIKASSWQATDILFPIPQNERALNANLTQNPGYN